MFNHSKTKIEESHTNNSYSIRKSLFNSNYFIKQGFGYFKTSSKPKENVSDMTTTSFSKSSSLETIDI